jgi:hypothetical protein
MAIRSCNQLGSAGVAGADAAEGGSNFTVALIAATLWTVIAMLGIGTARRN